MIRIKNWAKYQHYRDRNPPWIKLHYDLLSSPDWVMLDDASRVLLIACMLIGSRNAGEVPDDPEYMRRVAYLSKPADFKPLIKCGFLVNTCKQMLADASNLQADARPETETETETDEMASSVKPDEADAPQNDAPKPTAKRKTTCKAKLATEADWLQSIKAAYEPLGIDVDRELAKANGWLLGPKGKGRVLTQSYFLNWLNRCDRVMTQKKTPAPPRPGMAPAKIAEIAAHISAGCADLDAVLARSSELGRILEEEGSKQQDIDKMRVMDAVKAMMDAQKRP